MLLRDELSRFLADLYRYENFEDLCQNGLQVQGKEKIERIIFGVSFNLLFLQRALEKNPDAIIVHHGIFQPGAFKITGPLKQKIKILMDHEISLYGIHLPMDCHPQMGHGALLLSAIGAEGIEPFGAGARGENAGYHSLDHILETFHRLLHPQDFVFSLEKENPAFPLSYKFGFTVLRNGPASPGRMVIITGESSNFYEDAAAQGVDTFFGGDCKERIPAISYETHTNFVNLGHYFSEKPGVLALMKKIEQTFEVSTGYIEIPNPL